MRKFTCPFCGYEHIFPPKGKSKYRKRVSGFTCPRCQKKVTDDDISRAKGRRVAKPKSERRKRGRKEVKETPTIVVSHPEEQPETRWKTREDRPRERRKYAVKPGWQPKPPRQLKPLQPVDQTLGESLGLSLQEETDEDETYDPISGLHSEDLELEENEELDRLREEREALENIREGLERQEKKLVVLVTDLNRAEEQIGTVVNQLGKLEGMLQNFATLMSRMDELLEHYEARKIRQR